MTTQAEVAAGVDYLRRHFDELIPGMFRSYVTEEMMFIMVLGVLDAGEAVRNAPVPPSADE